MEDLLDRFALTHAAARKVSTYSGGMRRRLDIAMNLIGNPIGRVHGVGGERVRQRYHRGLAHASVDPRPGEVFRAWDHVHGVLVHALGTRTGELDPSSCTASSGVSSRPRRRVRPCS